jgi:protein-tyrosine phosphatase
MAEYLLRHRLNQTGVWFGKVQSAGVSALTHQPADKVVEELLLGRNIDVTSHRAIQLTDRHVHEADLVLVMETFHRDQILKRVPAARGKTFLLGHWQDIEIHDPYKRSKYTYADTMRSIDSNLTTWIDKIALKG